VAELEKEVRTAHDQIWGSIEQVERNLWEEKAELSQVQWTIEGLKDDREAGKKGSSSYRNC